MSRVGRRPVPIPKGVTVEQIDGAIRVTGPKGTLSERMPDSIAVELGDEKVRFSRTDERRETRALHGLARALVGNMVTGVTEGFHKDLEIEGVGYRAEAEKQKLTLIVGYSHPVELPVPEDLSVKVERNTLIRVEGISRQQVGQFAAEVRAVRPPEPYKGKGIRYAGERVRRKVGKAGAA